VCVSSDVGVASDSVYDADTHLLFSRRTAREYYHVGGLLLITLCIKMVTTVITMGAKIPAGVFVPHMAFGATLGYDHATYSPILSKSADIWWMSGR
jgi:H+/Cl- antiporter ClcA